MENVFLVWFLTVKLVNNTIFVLSVLINIKKKVENVIQYVEKIVLIVHCHLNVRPVITFIS
jgi:hypothetical protein